ncbi:MAG: alpha/beta fold hydrolase [Deltaproteobacteria bacterium]|jgi:pimeloyl-ACP methyl ester carboxylesterase|nr:alpha/beta fold hydrolase [Deltaproteobacteria bacterium]MBW2537637.1 alpha/beta fold hydrolase [Deltaproteobacteria bacterium]
MAATAVVLLHPFSLDRRFWQPQLERLSASDPERVVAALDLRGFGQNQRGELYESIDGHARDVLAELDRLAIVRALFVGLSMGGYVALALHRLAPERVAGLVLANTTARADDDERRAQRAEQARRYERDGIATLPDEWIPALVGPSASADLKLDLRRIMLEQSRFGVAAALRMMAARPDATGELSSIRVPVAVVSGEHDGLTPPRVLRDLAQSVPRAYLYEIPGVGHLSSLEAPEEFNVALVRALALVEGEQEG